MTEAVHTYLGTYYPVGDIPFTNTDTEGDLDVAARFYQSVDPTRGMFLFAPDGTGRGVASAAGRPTTWPSDVTHEFRPSLIFMLERGQDCIRLYSAGRPQGDYYLSDATGVWTARSYPALEQRVASMAPPGIAVELVRAIMDRAFELSHRRIGATLIAGDKLTHDDVYKMRVLTNVVLASSIDESMFADVARLDGAVSVSSDGVIHCNGAILRPKGSPDRTSVREGGGRHASAENFSAASPNHLVVVVSENRTVSVLVAGEYIVTRE
jgi:hypothetical protein